MLLSSIFLLLCLILFANTDGFVVRRPSRSSRPVGAVTSHRRHQPLSMAAKTGGKVITSDEQFTKDVKSSTSSRPTMVFFTAPWCGPCRLSIPVVKEVTKEYSGDIELVEVCTDDFPEVAANAGVVSIPTIQLYHKGRVRDTIVGCVAKKVLSRAISKILEDIENESTKP